MHPIRETRRDETILCCSFLRTNIGTLNFNAPRKFIYIYCYLAYCIRMEQHLPIELYRTGEFLFYCNAHKNSIFFFAWLHLLLLWLWLWFEWMHSFVIQYSAVVLCQIPYFFLLHTLWLYKLYKFSSPFFLLRVLKK